MKSRVRLLSMFVSAVIAAVSLGASATESRQVLSVNDIVSSYESHDGEVVSIHACLNVTDHGMSLIDCKVSGSRQVIFEPADMLADEAYNSILAAGFESSRNEAMRVQVWVSGILHVRREGYPLFRLSLQGVSRICKDYKP